MNYPAYYAGQLIILRHNTKRHNTKQRNNEQHNTKKVGILCYEINEREEWRDKR